MLAAGVVVVVADELSTVVAAPVPLEEVATVVVDDPDDPPFAPGVPGVVVDGTGPPTTGEVDPGLTAAVLVGATFVAGVTVVVDADRKSHV